MSSEATALTLYQLNRRIATLLNNRELQNVWVTAELSDVAVRGGHCYLELLQKDPESGSTVAKARAAIWANIYRVISSRFLNATGQTLASGIKVMVCLSVSMHPVYGLSLIISDINPDYTMGDLLRRRREMLARLTAEGIIDANKNLAIPVPALRIAIISADGAAGYGDFIHQLASDTHRFRFITRLFPAIMQGERTAASVMNALIAIKEQRHMWDIVVIIRGGGATSDLYGFENYDLAEAIARFPLPVMVGIGHERDITVLDYVAAVRVKTPTAAAEWLIDKATAVADRLNAIASAMALAATSAMSGYKEQLNIIAGSLTLLPAAVIDRATTRLDRCAMLIQQASAHTIQPHMMQLARIGQQLYTESRAMIQRHDARIDTIAQLLHTLSPRATLQRGYSITRCHGKALLSAATVTEGSVIVTELADGSITSVTAIQS